MGFEDVGEAYLLTRQKTGSDDPWPTALDMMLALSKLMSVAEGQPLTHGMEMAVVAGLLAETLGGTEKDRERLMQAALLHDMGLFQLLGRIQPEHEPTLAQHALHLLSGKTPPDIPGLERHLMFPTALLPLLHLDEDLPRWVAYHHTFFDRTGLVPDVASVEQPTPLMNLLTFCDGLVCAMAGITNWQTRYEKGQAFIASLSPKRILPEIVDAYRTRFEQPDDLKILDHRALERRVFALYPKAQASPCLNGSEILEICRWIGLQADARQPQYTQGEATLTAELMVTMGLSLELPLQDLGQLALAGFLHDVGKVALSLDFLTTPRTLIADDRDRLCDHARLAEAIFADVPGFKTVAMWIGAHHECLNGSGYPYGRRRQEIPVGARLLALADSYVALTRPRPFRPMPYRPQDALEILKKQQGRSFDPSLLKLLEDTVCRKGYTPTS
jgi:HD-GYP domain-containing protein (c-di-GMP phosphodiesterase class II)